MYKTKCPECGKTLYTYAKNKLGHIPVIYCSKVCEGKAREKRKYITP